MSLSADAVQGADFRKLASPKSLKRLELHGKSLGDDAMAEVGRITSLESFYTVASAVTAKGISSLKPLKYLVKLAFADCKGIDDSALPALKDLKLLRELNICGTGITDAGAAELKKALRQCQISR